MTFFSILLALIFEQQHALRSQPLIAKLLRYQMAAVRQFDASKTKYAIIAWLSIVLPWTLGVGLIYIALYQIHFIFALLWNIVVVYFTLGFRQFSQYFTAIQRALNDNNVLRARNILRMWINIDCTDMPVSEIVRHALIHALVAAHRYVFGVFFWFLMPIGPAGSVLYRIAHHLAEMRVNSTAEEQESAPLPSPAPFISPFIRFAARAFYLIDWIPARLTAFSFAVVGNFEDAIYAWRNTARQWQDSNKGVLLAASSGALGIQLMEPPSEPSSIEVVTDRAVTDSAESESAPVTEDCTPRTLSLAVALVWRAIVLWMLLLLMVTVAVWVG